LQVALRFCRDVSTGEGLVSRFKRVPESYVDRRAGLVTCPCGEQHAIGPLVEAACGRWFAGDESGVWAAKLEAAPA
jgi:hypothetical protein